MLEERSDTKYPIFIVFSLYLRRFVDSQYEVILGKSLNLKLQIRVSYTKMCVRIAFPKTYPVCFTSNAVILNQDTNLD